ncbi:hypothetical protein HDU96_009193 [Phlyctochytrium bullatum]|nr:hypothetical protein HDU96_009193 [Phlyctochytrium bullatum]
MSIVLHVYGENCEWVIDNLLRNVFRPYEVYGLVHHVEEVQILPDNPAGILDPITVVRATKTMGKFQVIGMYEGRIEFHMEQAREIDIFRRYEVERKNVELSLSEIKVKKDIMDSTGYQDDPLYEEGTETLKSDLVINGLLCTGTYSWVTRIRDVRDAFNDSKKPESVRTLKERANVGIVEIHILGWPYVFLVTLRDIHPGEELLICLSDEVEVDALLMTEKKDRDFIYKTLRETSSNLKSCESRIPEIDNLLAESSVALAEMQELLAKSLSVDRLFDERKAIQAHLSLESSSSSPALEESFKMHFDRLVCLVDGANDERRENKGKKPGGTSILSQSDGQEVDEVDDEDQGNIEIIIGDTPEPAPSEQAFESTIRLFFQEGESHLGNMAKLNDSFKDKFEEFFFALFRTCSELFDDPFLSENCCLASNYIECALIALFAVWRRSLGGYPSDGEEYVNTLLKKNVDRTLVGRTIKGLAYRLDSNSAVLTCG